MASYFGGRDERYKLRGGTVLVIDGEARDELFDMIVPYCHEAAENIMLAANATSSWGGYEAYYNEGGAYVSAFNASDGERGRRLLAALGSAQEPSEPKLTYTTKAGKKREATQAQIDNWTRGR